MNNIAKKIILAILQKVKRKGVKLHRHVKVIGRLIKI
jgi:hypothetical protein